MLKSCLVIMLCVAMSRAAEAQIPLDSVAPGTPVRITAPAWRLSNHPNVLDSLRRDTIFLRQFYVPAEDVIRMEARRGRMTWEQGARRGFRRGALTGLAISSALLVVGIVGDSQSDCDDCMITGTALALGVLPVITAVSAVTGGLIGSARPPERWTSVRLQMGDKARD